MERSVVNRYFKKIIEALEECEIKLQKYPTLKSSGKRIGVDGWYGDGVIVVRNAKNVNFALILIHEALHHIYPDLPEIICEDEPTDLFAQKLLCEFSTMQTNTILLFLPKVK